jgi:hypothetical protein
LTPSTDYRYFTINSTNQRIACGAVYLKDMKEQFGSWDLALRAYNSGPGSVDISNANATTTGPGDPTCVQKVLSCWQALESAGSLPA